MTKSQKEFEAWYKENINKDGPFMSCGKIFRSEHAAISAVAWQASRTGERLMNQVRDELDNLGVGYK